MRKDSCYIKYDWLDIFPEPVQFRLTSNLESAFKIITRKVNCLEHVPNVIAFQAFLQLLKDPYPADSFIPGPSYKISYCNS